MTLNKPSVVKKKEDQLLGLMCGKILHEGGKRQSVEIQYQ